VPTVKSSYLTLLAAVVTPACVLDRDITIGPNDPGALFSTAVPCTGNPSADGDALRTAVEGATDNTTVTLGPCLYQIRALLRDGYNTGILIGGKTGVIIQGAGAGETTVRFERPVYIGFEVRANSSILTIEQMTIAGSVNQSLCTENPDLNHPEADPPQWCYGDPASSRPNTHGISGPQASGDGFVFTNLEVKDLAVGIEVPAGSSTVSNNYVHDIHGTYPGSGYAIANGAMSIVIRDNVIVRAGRHSIYQGGTGLYGWGSNPNPVVIIGNTIVDHGHGGEIYSVQQSALTLARSDNVNVIDNTIVGGHAYGISVEYDAPPGTGRDCTRCLLIGNKFVNVGIGNGAPYDIWINAQSPAWTWLNVRDHDSPPHVKDDTGQQQDVAGPGDFWGGTQAISSMYHGGENGDYLYVMQNDVLHRVSPDYGINPEAGWRDYRYSTTNWLNFFGLTANDGKVYVWQNNTLHSVTPQWSNTFWPYTASGGWFNPGAIGSRGDGYLYVLQNFILHRVNPLDWSYVLSEAQWPGPYGIALGRDTVDVVYLRSGNNVFKVKPGADRTVWSWSILDW
jgi:hypothetical protein